MATEDKQVRKLREKLETALAKRKDDDALKLLGQLIEAEPKAPRWPHKRGELYVKRNRKTEAIADYTSAASLYADQGFLARAVAMAKTIIDLDPKRIDVLDRLDPEAARKLNREQRPDGLSLRPVAGHAAVVQSDPPMAAHPALLPEDGAAPPARAPSRVRDAVKRVVADELKAAKAKVGPSAPRLDAVPKPPPVPDRSQPVLDVAEELTIDPDAKPNETRFSNAPPARVIRPNISDVELEPRRAAPVPGSARPVPPDARTLSKLPLFPLFAELPQAALIEMVKRADVVELPDGAVVVRKGEPADALYGIVEGSVEIVVPGQTTKMTLAEGDVFGEACLLAGEKRHADVVVRGQLSALKIPRQVFKQLVAAHPVMAEILLELLTRRLLGNLLQSSPLFQELDARGRQEVAKLFEIRRAPTGMALAEVGKRMDGLYVNLTGTLEVTFQDGRPSESHEPGTMFGQSSLLTQQPSDVGVRALANMLVLRLPSRAFHTMAMQYPGMLAHVSELVSASVAKITT